jgi:hypothetical protein
MTLLALCEVALPLYDVGFVLLIEDCSCVHVVLYDYLSSAVLEELLPRVGHLLGVLGGLVGGYVAEVTWTHVDVIKRE